MKWIPKIALLIILVTIASCVVPTPKVNTPTPGVRIIKHVSWFCEPEVNPGLLSYQAWVDHNANGIRDPEDEPLEGFRLFLDIGRCDPDDVWYPNTFDDLLKGHLSAPPGHVRTTRLDVEKWKRDGYADLGFAPIGTEEHPPPVAREKPHFPHDITSRYNLGNEPWSLDPALPADSASVEVIEALFLGLTGFDPEGKVVAELATTWKASEDGLEWTFKLRDDAVWVNYQPMTGPVETGPVTASDVVYAVRRNCDPRTETVSLSDNYIVAGCKELKEADPDALSEEELQTLADAIGVEAVGDSTVKFTLNEPAGYFPALIALPFNWPLPRVAIVEHGEDWTEVGNLVTNGPYMLVERLPYDGMTLEQNPSWYGWAEGSSSGNIERIELIMVDETTAFAMYKLGGLDTVMVPSSDVAYVESHPLLSEELVIAPRACTYYYGFTSTKAPVDNVLVRKALSAAIDRRTLVEDVTKGGQIPANTLAHALVFGTAAEDPAIAPWALSEEQGGWGYGKALEQAQAWLAEAGYPSGEGFPSITILHNDSDAHAAIALAIQAMWKDGLGINATVGSLPWPLYLSAIENSEPLEEMPHVWRLGWCAVYPDQNNWLFDVFNTDFGPNRPRWEARANAPQRPEGKSFNQLTQEARVSLDPERRKSLYWAAEKILVDEAAAIAPIYYYTTVVLTRSYLERTYYPVGGQHFETWRIK